MIMLTMLAWYVVIAACLFCSAILVGWIAWRFFGVELTPGGKRKKIEQVYLSRRNLTTLLTKLDLKKSGTFQSACTIVKNDTHHPVYPQTMDHIMVTALEDEEYYTERKPGRVREDTVA